MAGCFLGFALPAGEHVRVDTDLKRDLAAADAGLTGQGNGFMLELGTGIFRLDIDTPSAHYASSLKCPW